MIKRGGVNLLKKVALIKYPHVLSCPHDHECVCIHTMGLVKKIVNFIWWGGGWGMTSLSRNKQTKCGAQAKTSPLQRPYRGAKNHLPANRNGSTLPFCPGMDGWWLNNGLNTNIYLPPQNGCQRIVDLLVGRLGKAYKLPTRRVGTRYNNVG